MAYLTKYNIRVLDFFFYFEALNSLNTTNKNWIIMTSFNLWIKIIFGS